MSEPSRESRLARWALGGVVVGFLLPLCLCVGLTFAAFAGFGAALNSAAASSTVGDFGGPQHVSGPLVGPAVALIELRGPIVSGDTSPFDFGGITVASSERLVRLIGAAAKNSDVQAILLRVDSPGGSVVASDEIYRALKQAGKPVVVQMGEVAASGGYYVSMAAEHIVAHPDTLTGSIGVISEFTNILGLYEKLGLESHVIKSGENKDFGNPTSPFTEEDRRLWQEVVDEVYEGFVRVVADGRKMSVEQVKALADGRLYTGRQALAAGLVDQLGSYQDALAEAARRGGITGEPRVLRYGAPSFWQLLGGTAVRAVLIKLGIPPSRLDARPVTLEYR
ncbi:MAG: signal peptide peptidase SppA [Thermoflexales bacterium]